MNIQIVSDIHAEFWENKEKFNFIKPSAPFLALVGDICCCGTDSDFQIFKRFILEVEPLYEHIFFVTGNHEYYFNTGTFTSITHDNTMQGIDKKIKSFFTKTSKKLHFLNNNSITITIKNTSYLIVGSTLWSWIPENDRKFIQTHMNDYSRIYISTSNRKIRNLIANDIASIHLKNYRYIKTQITKAKKNKQKLIVLTHHKPYIGNVTRNEFSVAYESDLSSIINNPIILWGYGHTHVADATMIKGVLLYSNPKGYPYEKTKYKPHVSVKI